MLSNYIKLIQDITSRPGMFLVNRVEDLALITFGFSHAMGQGNERKEFDDFINEFQSHVQNWSYNKEHRNWPSLIRFNSSTDSHSLELFKNVFANFLSAHLETGRG